ncbi:hypothetical protein QLR68_37660, partial [Micromonospora sp. DH15]|nr:hypothetical protein [Micromonospora sp. DH15]
GDRLHRRAAQDRRHRGRAGVSMMSQPIEVPGAREALRLSLGRFGTPQMVMRIGYGQPGSPTPRRSVDEVLDVPVGQA